MKATAEQIKSAFLGLIIGDELGVPVEFRERTYLANMPLTDMIGYGTYNQPPGTWSDDSSMMLCLAESLISGFDIDHMGRLFVKWYKEGYWTPYNHTFDIGNATAEALTKIMNGVSAAESGGNSSHHNGNGALMRILPLVFALDGYTEKQKFDMINKAASITHAHIRSTMGCYIYAKYAELLISEKNQFKAYELMQSNVYELFNELNIPKDEISVYHRILKKEIHNLDENQIESKGYVVYTLEAALWSFLNSNSYRETVLKAINLGEDTDTTAAVVGGLAGLFYGSEKIPKSWIEKTARLNDILELINKFSLVYTK
jgi:ADP-ribosylglycohydrolase